MVKEAAKLKTASELKETLQEQQEHHWANCPLSHRPLKVPIVSDSGGNLYNKDTILEYLIPSDDPADATFKADGDKILAGQVKSLKDVIEVKFQIENDRWICPITSKPLGAAVKSAYLVPCGHAFSDMALKEVAETKCLQCGEDYTIENIITILPTLPADKERLVKRMEALREAKLSHSLKKASTNGKKRKKHATEETEASANGHITTTKPTNTGIKNGATATLTARILAEEEEKAKRRKLERNKNIDSLFAPAKKGPMTDADFMTRGHSTTAELRR